LFGGNKGSAFNDFNALVGANTVTTSNLPSIREISLAYGDVIDGFSVMYTQGSGETRTTFSHGTSSNATDSGLRKSTVTLTADEIITTVSGRSGATSFGIRVIQVQFGIFNSATNTTRVQGPFGGGPGGGMFTIAGNGAVVAFGGYANNTDLSLSQLQGQGGGLYGFKFITANLTTFPCLSPI